MPEGTGPRDPRIQTLANQIARIQGGARWLAWVATRAAAAGGVSGVALWWLAAGGRVTDWWQGTAASVLVLALCLAPALWLVNVRMSLLGLLELPETLGGVAARRMGRAPAGPRPPAPAGGVIGALRSTWGVLRDYGDVTGSWGAVAQVLAPPFWVLTAVALLAVPLVVVLTLVAVLLAAG